MNTFLETRASRLFAHAACMAERFSGSENYSFVKTLDFSSVLATCLRLFPLVPTDQVWAVINDLLVFSEIHSFSYNPTDASIRVHQARLLDTACVFAALSVEAASRETGDNAAKTPDVYTVIRNLGFCTSSQCSEILEALEEHFTITPKL